MLNQRNKAIDDYSSILAFQPDNMLALLNRGVTYQMLDKMDQACEDWLKVAETGEKKSNSLYTRYCK
jgi:tetratricopeptide (TPR) repeat protein